MDHEAYDITTITVNPAIDHTLSIPHFTAGAVNRVERSQLDAGGKGVNVAAALADYGLSVAVTGFLGNENDERFRRLFAAKGIADHFVRIPGATRTGIKIIDRAKHQTTDINFPGQEPAPQDVDQLFRTVEGLAAGCDWFVISGSVPASTPPTIYAQLIQTLRARGKRVVLDASGAPLRAALTAGPSLIKPNLVELRELLDEPLESETAIVHAARQLAREFTIACVVVSMGEEGAICVDGPETAVLAAPSRVEVVSTVGAGDAMVAGLVAGKLRGAAPEECLLLATAFSMGAITRLGAGLPPKETIAQLMRHVSVRALTGDDGLPTVRARAARGSQLVAREKEAER